MTRLLRRALACAALLGAAVVPATAWGQSPQVPSPAQVPSAAPAAPSAVAGRLALVVQRAAGSPLFALVGRRIVVRGIVSPYVGGQAVKVGFYVDGREVRAASVAVAAVGNGEGQFHVDFTGARAGLVQARATHDATAQQGAFSARSQGVHFVNPNLGEGAQGQSVRVLQSELDTLHYAVPLTGSFEEGTGRALIAYRKMTGLERIPYAGRQVFEELARGAGRFHVRYPGDGRHVEADLSKQVLAEIEPQGRVRTIYEMSSGKPSTPTVLGRFQVYEKTPGENSEGMVDSNYFIRGYAIHGYAEVPTYAASHGCLRVPIPDAAAIYAWVGVGTRVDVYE
ncbi:MAG TPA: L,D-transpeptidase [Solirubrobacteraceae bacterium]|nr:L,D-transpeptidase [Solirubrobacteraceae bacterium]